MSPSRLKRLSLSLILAPCAVLTTGCDPRTPTTDVAVDPSNPDETPSDPTPDALHLEILEPFGDLAMSPGAQAQITVSSNDPLAIATIQLVADADGELATTADQHALATTKADGTTTPRTVTVAIPTNMPFGAYSILGTISDGVRLSADARARGRLLVEASHSLSLSSPATETTVSRGGRLDITFVATDSDGTADVRLLADGDGDATTTIDQYTLGTLTTSMQAPQVYTASLAAVPLGEYHILGVACDPGHADVVAAAPGRVRIASVAFAVQEGGNDYEEGRAIAVCPDSSLVVTGRFSGSCLFGDGSNFVSLNAQGDDDLFIARYSPTGTLLWARAAGGPSRGDWGNAVATFADGSVLVGGYFHGLASFNGAPVATGVLAAGDNDGFLARYSSTGVLQWVQRAGGVFHDDVSGVAVSTDGSCYATGQFAAEATFGQGDASTSIIVAGSLITTDGFVARYAGDGSLLWVRRFGGAAGNDRGTSIAVHGDGSCVVTGTFVGSVAFGEGPSQVILTSAGGTDVFVARYDALGNLAWAKRGGGTADDDAGGITLSPDGAALACGTYAGTATFGDTPGIGTLQPAGGRDAYLVRLSTNGSVAWIRGAGSTADDEAHGIDADSDGSCIVTGAFRSTAVFGVSPAAQTLTAIGLRDAFIARYDAQGGLVWVRRAGGTAHDGGYAVAAGADGSCATTGFFQGDATFGSGPSAVMRTAAGLSDVFVMRSNVDGDF